ncbi:Intraflagellar transport protein 88-like protein [Acropora cervicornis]|uniref:Intraflagellar transport protein 88-like protein n=1 Tax=Acropora cervicornis TaxID=6130 RepID=A0AAD9VDX8_ACRCE|nr:Intraflagellar transport protein 88-like protein [Acropora cervicornis]
MLSSVHLVGEDEDDLYSGFNEYNPAFDTEKTGVKSLSTSAGRGKVPGSSMGRPVTGIADTGTARPMTAVRAVGYTSSERAPLSGGGQFDPFNQGRLPAPPLEVKNEESPEEKVKQMEKKVNELIEESCFANDRGDYPLALEKAKEAGRKERALCRQREQTALGEQINLDLTYSVLFNLANQYHANKMYAEALNTYQVIVKNKMFSNAGRLRVNMGNIYYEQKKYPQAIKQYRMALDQVPNTHKEMRIKIMQNIGISFVKMAQFNDAITSFEHIMAEKASFDTGFNLLLCHYALKDKEKMKKTFQKLLSVSLGFDDEDKYTLTGDDPQQALILEVIRNDKLRQIERQKKSQADKSIMTAAKLISPAIENTFAAGFDWCIECVKSSPYLELANELEITKAITYLKEKDLAKAIETLKGFEKKDSKVQSTAATNLSFLYFLENDVTQADKYAELAMTADRYNPAALVNKGNCFFASGDYDKAKEYEMLDDKNQAIEWYMQLVSVVPTDPSVLSKLGELYDSEQDKSQAFQYHFEFCEKAIHYFEKAAVIQPNEVKWQLMVASCYRRSGNYQQALETYKTIHQRFPDNVECLKFLVRICTDLGLKDVQDYAQKLKKAEKARELKQQRATSGTRKGSGRAGSGNLPGSAGSRNSSSGSGSEGVDSSGGRRSANRSAGRTKPFIADNDDSFSFGGAKDVDATYADPLGEAPVRPKTAGRQRPQQVEDEFGDEEIGDDLLPE